MKTLLSNLYKKYLNGRLTENELQTFKQMVAQATDEELWEVMQQTPMPHVEIPVNIKEEIMGNLELEIRKSRRNNFMRYAAAISLFLITVSGLFYFFRQAEPTNLAKVSVAPGNRASIVLPDGTKVSLNSGTDLEYDVEAGDHRYVNLLKGEAFFEVTKDRKHPFRVSTGDMNIQVLGTTFNVKAGDSQVEASLFTGKIQIDGEKIAQAVTLSPGEKAIYTKKDHKIVVGSNDSQRDMKWKDGYLIFESTPLKDVLARIGEWYGVSIRYTGHKYSHDLLSGTFHNEPLQSVLKTLSMQYGFQYQIVENQIIIK
uniref:FecR domain-containing protein n=1 Tax=Prevotella sp. GTC17253 TaxID=3236793 RepID=A0AB33IWD7_9BACT